MFLIRGGHVALTLLSLDPSGQLSVLHDTTLDDQGLGFRAMQGVSERTQNSNFAINFVVCAHLI